jgi:hypothetical protein
LGSSSVAAAMSTNSAIAIGSGHNEPEVSMSEVLNRLKSIEEMMHPLIPLNDQVVAFETAFTKHNQQQQLLSVGLLWVEREQRNQGGPRTPNNHRRIDDDATVFPTTHKMEFPKYEASGIRCPGSIGVSGISACAALPNTGMLHTRRSTSPMTLNCGITGWSSTTVRRRGHASCNWSKNASGHH